jgi:hypothetical protein
MDENVLKRYLFKFPSDLKQVPDLFINISVSLVPELISSGSILMYSYCEFWSLFIASWSFGLVS